MVSCGLPADSDGQSSNVCAAHPRVHLLTLLQVGFTKPRRSPNALVVSYTTFSPLLRTHASSAVCSLWHFPAGYPGWALPTTLPCGARTFLDSAVTCLPRPPGQLACSARIPTQPTAWKVTVPRIGSAEVNSRSTRFPKGRLGSATRARTAGQCS